MASVLFLDDHPDEVTRFVEALRGRVECTTCHPEEVTRENLAVATLILVDSRLDNWPERDQLPQIALQPLDGRALAAVLRAHSETAREGRLTAFAVLTAHPEDYSHELLADNLEPSLARSNNLEWIFRKRSPIERVTKQIVILAQAVDLLPRKWPMDSLAETEALLVKLLDIKDERDWALRALSDAKKCQPPVRELSEWTHGMELLRWVLHRILPYPCFLWDYVRVAARLRMTPASLLRVLNSDTTLTRKLAECEYSGLAAQFLGNRWWRSGIESMLWDLTGGAPFDGSILREILSQASDKRSEPSLQTDPIVCIDQNYRPMETFSDIGSSVRLMLDDWPSFADQPWTTIEVAKEHPALLAAVVEQDLEKLDPNLGVSRG
jgi:hypothetical protein